jgi:hypothetical protein
MVGVTHECDFLPNHSLYLSADPLLASDGSGGGGGDDNDGGFVGGNDDGCCDR